MRGDVEDKVVLRCHTLERVGDTRNIEWTGVVWRGYVEVVDERVDEVTGLIFCKNSLVFVTKANEICLVLEWGETCARDLYLGHARGGSIGGHIRRSELVHQNQR